MLHVIGAQGLYSKSDKMKLQALLQQELPADHGYYSIMQACHKATTRCNSIVLWLMLITAVKWQHVVKDCIWLIQVISYCSYINEVYKCTAWKTAAGMAEDSQPCNY